MAELIITQVLPELVWLNGNWKNKMTTQNYLIISTTTNTVENICLWDGDTSAWQPPDNTLLLPQESTNSKVWVLNADKTDFELQEIVGQASIGFTWDGSICTTNDPKPVIKQIA